MNARRWAPWRKTFKHEDHLHDWAEKNDADVHGTRELEGAKKSVKEGLKPQHNMRPGWMLKADPELAAKEGKFLAKLKKWYTPFEILNMATASNGELIKLCGPRDTYPGKLGVIEEGALADMILVNGNPLENIDLVVDPENNFPVIMKDGIIYKNTLQ